MVSNQELEEAVENEASDVPLLRPIPVPKEQGDEDMQGLEMSSLECMSEQKRSLTTEAQAHIARIYRLSGVECSEQEARAIGECIGSLGGCGNEWIKGVEVAEVYSPPRFTALSSRFGLRAGLCVDLETQKENGESWDLSKKSDRDELEMLQAMQEPMVLTGSPPCTAFSRLLALSRSKRGPADIKRQKEEGMMHLKTACDAYRRRYEAGRYFLHEHPASADSWSEECVLELMNLPGVQKVRGPMCRWHMSAEDGEGRGYVRKETCWLTNSPQLAKVLEGECTNKDPSKEWHRHVHLTDGRAKGAQVYPPRLMHGVLKAIKRQLELDGGLNAVDAFASGPMIVG